MTRQQELVGTPFNSQTKRVSDYRFPVYAHHPNDLFIREECTLVVGRLDLEDRGPSPPPRWDHDKVITSHPTTFHVFSVLGTVVVP